MRRLNLIYFIDGVVPTKEDKEEYEPYQRKDGVKVHFKNARKLNKDHTPTKADGVFGAVSYHYSDYPSAEQAYKDFQEEMEKLQKKTGDEKAPEIKSDKKERPPLKEAPKSSEKKKTSEKK